MINIGVPSLIQPKQVIFGSGSSNYLVRSNFSRVCIIGSKRSLNNYKFISRINSSKRFHSKTIELNLDNQEPSFDKINSLLKPINKFQPDLIIAIGGGSIIDSCKILWANYEYPNIKKENLEIPFSIPPLRKKSKFICVPTTCGSGSESSSAATLINKNNGKKIIVTSHDFIPDLVILDDELLNEIPKKIMFNGILDALCHTIEGFNSIIKNEAANKLVELSLLRFSKICELNKRKNFKELKKEALYNSYIAGIIQNNKLVGPAHALAHNMSFIPHGLATGMFLPKILDKICKKDTAMKDKYKNLFKKTINVESCKDLKGIIEDNIYESTDFIFYKDKIKKLSNRQIRDIAKNANDDSLNKLLQKNFKKNDYEKILNSF